MLAVPLAVALAGLLAAAVADGLGRRRASTLVVVVALAVAAVISEAVALLRDSRDILGGTFAAGGTPAALVAMVFALGALAAAALTDDTDGDTAPTPPFAVLVAVGTLCAALAVSARDLMVLLLAIEAVSLAGYALVAGTGTDVADEAAMKYFLQGSLATGVFAYGIAVAVGLFGHTGYAALAAVTSTSGAAPAVLAGGLLVAALAFKAGLVPFHTWVPDAYGASRPAVAGFLSSVPKLAALVAAWFVLRTGVLGPASEVRVSLVFAALAAASIVVGNLSALRQERFTRMLGYSAIAQAGYAAVAISVPPSPEGSMGGFMGLVVLGGAYALASLGSFALAEWLTRAEGWDGSIAQLAGLSRRRPMAAAAATVCMLSLTGIPLTAGFWGKLLVFGSVVTGPRLWLAVVGVIGSVVSFGYYGGVIRAAYLEEAPEAEPEEESPDSRNGRGAAAVAVTCAVLLIGFGIYPLVGATEPLMRLLGGR